MQVLRNNSLQSYQFWTQFALNDIVFSLGKELIALILIFCLWGTYKPNSGLKVWQMCSDPIMMKCSRKIVSEN